MKYAKIILVMFVSAMAICVVAETGDTQTYLQEELLVQTVLLPKADVYRLIRTEGRLSLSNVMTFIETRQAQEAGAPLILRIDGNNGMSITAQTTMPYAGNWTVVPGTTNAAGKGGEGQVAAVRSSYFQKYIRTSLCGAKLSPGGRLYCSLNYSVALVLQTGKETEQAPMHTETVEMEVGQSVLLQQGETAMLGMQEAGASQVLVALVKWQK